MKVAQWLQQHQSTLNLVSPKCTLLEMLDLLLEGRSLTDIYVIDQQGRLLGHIPRWSVLSHYLVEHDPVQSRRQLIHRVTSSCAEEMMEPHLYMAKLDEDMDDVLPRQLQQGVAELAVVDDEQKLCGVIDLHSVAHSLRTLERASRDNSTDNP